MNPNNPSFRAEYSFLEFDEDMAQEFCDTQIELIAMKNQHSKDAAIFKQLIEIIEKMEKALMIYSSTEYETDDRPTPWEAREALAELNKWRNE
jgi:hypothetical protein